MRIAQLPYVTALIAALAVSACGVGGTEPGPGPGGDGDGSGDGSGGGDGMGDGSDGLAGQLAGGELSGDIHLVDDATIAAGVTVSMAAGSSFTAAEGKRIVVEGELSIDGTADAPVSMMPEQGAGPWGGIVVASGGSLTIRYATGTQVAQLVDCQAGASQCVIERIDFFDVSKIVRAEAAAVVRESMVETMANGAFAVVSGGDLSIVDSDLRDSTHDLVVASGGNLTIEYTNIGGDDVTYEHCNLHISSADSLVVTHSNLISSQYGIMLGTVPGAQLNYNNWVGNANDVSVVGSPTGANLQNNYWSSGPPPAALSPELDYSNAETEAIADTGPRI